MRVKWQSGGKSENQNMFNISPSLVLILFWLYGRIIVLSSLLGCAPGFKKTSISIYKQQLQLYCLSRFVKLVPSLLTQPRAAWALPFRSRGRRGVPSPIENIKEVLALSVVC